MARFSVSSAALFALALVSPGSLPSFDAGAGGTGASLFSASSSSSSSSSSSGPLLASAMIFKDKEILKASVASCKKRCSPSGKVKPPPEACESYKEQRPYPQLWQICQDSFKAGTAAGCTLGCSEREICFGMTNTPDFAREREQGCAQYDAMLPRPTMANACRAGFTKGADSTCSESHVWLTHEYQEKERAAAQDRALQEADRLATMEASLQREEQSKREKEAAAKRAEEERARRTKEKEDAARKKAEEEEAAKKGKTRGMKTK
jgi:hypothetical protein